MTVTVERLENAITMTAYVMAHHNLPQLLPTLKRLEAERDRLLQEGDPIEYATYAASKGGVHSLVRVLSRRAVSKNILVNGVAPGVVRTPLLESVSSASTANRKLSPLGRAAEAHELGWPIALLCTPAASFMSGAVLDINGGSFVG